MSDNEKSVTPEQFPVHKRLWFCVGLLEIMTEENCWEGFKKLCEYENKAGLKLGPLYATIPFKPNPKNTYELRVWDGKEVGSVYCGHVDSGGAKSKLLLTIFCERRDVLLRIMNEFTNYVVPTLVGKEGDEDRQAQMWRIR